MSSYFKTVVFFNYLSYGFNILYGLVIFPVVLNQLGAREAGIFSLLYSIKNIISIGIGWLSGSIVKNMLEYKHRNNEINSLSLLLNCGYGILASVGLLIFGILSKKINFTIIMYFSLYIGISFFNIPLYELFLGKYMQWQPALLKFIQSLFVFLVTMCYVFFYNLHTLVPVIKIMAIIASLNFIMTLILIFFSEQVSLKFKMPSYEILKVVLVKDAFKYFFFGAVVILSFQIDYILITFFLGLDKLAEYVILWKFPSVCIIMLWQYLDPLQLIFKRKVENKDYEAIRVLYMEKFIFIFSVGVLLVLFYIFFGKYVLMMWVGKDHIPTAVTSYLIPALVMFWFVVQRLSVSLTFYNNSIFTIAVFQVLILLTKIIFAKVLLDRYGIIGIFIPILALAIPYLYIVHRYIKQNYFKEVIA